MTLAGVEVGDEQGHRMGFGERAEALLAGLERLLHRLARGDVDVEAADVGDAAVGVAHREPDHQLPGVLSGFGRCSSLTSTRPVRSTS